MGRATGERAMAERSPDATEDFSLPLMLWPAGAAEALAASAGVAKPWSPPGCGGQKTGMDKSPALVFHIRNRAIVLQPGTVRSCRNTGKKLLRQIPPKTGSV